MHILAGSVVWVRRALSELGDALLAGLYPARCAACDEPLAEQGGAPPLLCVPCRSTLLPVGPERCPRCGRPRPGLTGREARERCGACRAAPPPFAEARAGFEYGGALADAVRRCKYRGQPGLAAPLARLLLEELGPLVPPADVVVPVPLHVRRLRARGYNQAAELARTLARAWALPLCVDALVRARDTPPQVHQPTAAARAGNVTGAFVVRRRGAVTGRAVVLVDDVMTTGATAAACATALRAAGAERVLVRTVARG